MERGLELSPRNARAHALRGFVASGRNRLKEAAEAFARAVELDGAFGNGWLGSGLVKIRRGDLEAGREDLQTATTVEPTVSLFHSYLGKAFSQEGLGLRAAQDLALAKELDPGDPTPWLYSAIDLQQGNRVNEAIGDLEESIRLNDNRRIYRSGFLLDQDRAVRGANLAKLYQDAGMSEVAVREATRAVGERLHEPVGAPVSGKLVRCAARPDADFAALRDAVVQRAVVGEPAVAGGWRGAVAVCLAAGVLEAAGVGRARRERVERVAQRCAGAGERFVVWNFW